MIPEVSIERLKTLYKGSNLEAFNSIFQNYNFVIEETDVEDYGEPRKTILMLNFLNIL